MNTPTHPIVDRLAAQPRGQMLGVAQLADVLGKSYSFANALCITGKVGAVRESAGAGHAPQRDARSDGSRMRQRYDISPLAVLLYLIRAQHGDVADVLAAVAVHFPMLHAACEKHAAAKAAGKTPEAEPLSNIIPMQRKRTAHADPYSGHPDFFKTA